MKRTYPKILRNRQNRSQRRRAPQHWAEPPRPMFEARRLHCEMAARGPAVQGGGIGARPLMGQRVGGGEDIDRNLPRLKAHPPCHERDPGRNLAANIRAGGVRWEDIEPRRPDENFLNGWDAQRRPDPTTAGDFTRRFQAADILSWQAGFHRSRQAIGKAPPEGCLPEAFIDVDGTRAGTRGECQEGIGLSYKGIWGAAPPIASRAQTKAGLSLMNRPGPSARPRGSVEWSDRAADRVEPGAGTVAIRGDTDFTRPAHLDRWEEAGRRFLLGLDAPVKVVGRAASLPARAWQRLERWPQYEILTEPRRKAFRDKEPIGIEKEFRNQKLVGEDIAEIDGPPGQCGRKCRWGLGRKNRGAQQGARALREEIRYGFSLANRKDAAEKSVGLANGRGAQENGLEQWKNGVKALRLPVPDLLSNWACRVRAAWAWNRKSWHGLLLPNRERGLELARAEFRKFLNAVMWIACQMVRTARRVIYRVLGYNSWRADFFATWEGRQRLGLVEERSRTAGRVAQKQETGLRAGRKKGSKVWSRSRSAVPRRGAGDGRGEGSRIWKARGNYRGFPPSRAFADPKALV